MIQYALKCSDGHRFESWFQSAAAFDKLAGAGHLSCAVCGGSKVEKAIMAPRVRPGRKAVSALGEPAPETAPDSEAAAPTPSAPANVPQMPTPAAQEVPQQVQEALAELRKKVEANSDYVGNDFVSEARAMHLGEAPERAIYGEAKLEDAKELIEDGVPVVPLPFIPGRKTN